MDAFSLTTTFQNYTFTDPINGRSRNRRVQNISNVRQLEHVFSIFAGARYDYPSSGGYRLSNHKSPSLLSRLCATCGHTVDCTDNSHTFDHSEVTSIKLVRGETLDVVVFTGFGQQRKQLFTLPIVSDLNPLILDIGIELRRYCEAFSQAVVRNRRSYSRIESNPLFDVMLMVYIIAVDYDHAADSQIVTDNVLNALSYGPGAPLSAVVIAMAGQSVCAAEVIKAMRRADFLTVVSAKTKYDQNTKKNVDVYQAKVYDPLGQELHYNATLTGLKPRGATNHVDVGLSVSIAEVSHFQR
ncbi:MAG: hypothetical protein QWI73_06715 [Alphaproteobacteria bacterium]|nr:hypothetical protein [Alphaproteobacteria bacterium]